MQPLNIKVKKLPHFDPALPLPGYETPGAAGADLRACLEGKADLVIKPGDRVLVPSGLVFEIPPGFEMQVRPRSGVSYKTGLMVLNSPGTIDSDYRGELKIILGNLGKSNEIIRHGDRIAQIVIAPIMQASFLSADSLSQTTRGDGGLGSTGKN